jgi:hypothetical protein
MYGFLHLVYLACDSPLPALWNRIEEKNTKSFLGWRKRYDSRYRQILHWCLLNQTSDTTKSNKATRM